MKILTALLLLTGIALAGDVDRPNTVLLHYNSSSIQSAHSIGFSNLNDPLVSEFSSCNPAALFRFNEISFGANFIYGTSIDFSIADYEKSMPYIPASAGFVLPLDNIKLGLAYRQKYNAKITVDDPDLDYHADEIIHSFSIAGAYLFSDLFTDNDKFSIGLQVAADYYRTSVGGIVEGTGSGYGVSGMFGLTYDLSREFSIGIMYEKGTDLDVKYESPDIQTTDEEYLLKQPDQVIVGVQAIPTEGIKVSATVAAVLWENDDDRYANSLDISANCIFQILPQYDMSLGFYSNNIKTEDDFSSNSSVASYLGIGIKGDYGPLVVNFEILNSDLFSSIANRRTLFKLGLDFAITKSE